MFCFFFFPALLPVFAVAFKILDYFSSFVSFPLSFTVAALAQWACHISTQPSEIMFNL